MKKSPEWLQSAVFYQIYPQSFCDSNADGIGDIPGIIRKLSYLKWLGVNALWLNPCFVSPFKDAGYDVADYYRVAPRYGDNADLKRLFNEAHRRGMKVLLDLVPGHTSDQHPWFQASCKAKKNRYSDWYVWTKSVWDCGASPKPGFSTPRFINGYAERDGNFTTNFFFCQPALNFGFARRDPRCKWQQSPDDPGPQAVRAEVRKIMDFWLRMGADGFRVDMAPSLIKNDKGRLANMALWRENRAWLERKYPGRVLISEWGEPRQSIPGGFHMDFLLPFEHAAYASLFRAEIFHYLIPDKSGNFFATAGKGNISIFVKDYLSMLKKTRGRGFIAIPSGNHDMARVSAHRSMRDLKIVFAFLLTQPGVPYIYYGDEIGMRNQALVSKEGGYSRTGARTPMQWNAEKNAGFSRGKASQLYLPIDSSSSRPSVEQQRKDPASLLNAVKAMIALRNAEPALQAKGDYEVLYAKTKKYPFVYLRRKGKVRFVVALNPAARPVSVSLKLRAKSVSLCSGLGAKLVCGKAGSRLEMSGASYGIFKLD
jgi:maltose alpha-D-glucosyltransferase/alpha-amylase